MVEGILGGILIIPLYAVLIWSYFNPEESMLFGKRWMYVEEPEVSEGAIRYIKVVSFISIIMLTLFLVLFFITR